MPLADIVGSVNEGIGNALKGITLPVGLGSGSYEKEAWRILRFCLQSGHNRSTISATKYNTLNR